MLRHVAVMFACALLGCADDVTSPTVELVAGGRIVGRVRTGSSSVDATLRVMRIHDRDETSLFSVEVNRNGTFQLDVPAGLYTVRLDAGSTFYYREAGLACGARPDTLLVDDAHSPVTVNFDLATARVRIDLPLIYNDQSAAIRLHQQRRPGTSACTFREYARVRNGAAETTFSAILPGAYRVEVELESSGDERVWLPGVRDSADATWFDVSVNEVLGITGRLDAEPASLQGKIVGAWIDLGLDWRPRVDLFALDSTRVHRGTGVDVDGTFEVHLVLAEPVKALVDQQGITQWIGGRSFAEAQVFDLQPGETIAGVELVQSGLRLDLQGSSFSNFGADISLFDASTLERVVYWSWPWWLGAGDVIPMPNLLPGTYLMRIESGSPGSSPWAPQWFDRAETPMQATPIMLARGEVKALSVSLERGGTIAGSVRDLAGEGGSYRVRLTMADDPSIWATRFVSTLDPTFLIQGLPNGDWKVSAQRTGATIPEPPRVWYPSTTDWESAEIIPVRDHGDVTGIEIVLPVDTP